MSCLLLPATAPSLFPQEHLQEPGSVFLLATLAVPLFLDNGLQLHHPALD